MNEFISDSEEESAIPLIAYRAQTRQETGQAQPEIPVPAAPDQGSGLESGAPLDPGAPLVPDQEPGPQINPENDEIILSPGVLPDSPPEEVDLHPVPVRSLRKRKANQLRPYTYDTFKYGNINYSSQSRPSSPLHSSQYLDTDSVPEDSLEHQNPDQLDFDPDQLDQLDHLDSDPGAFELARSPDHHKNDHRRVIDSSDSEDLSAPEFVAPVRQPKFLNMSSSYDEQQASVVEHRRQRRTGETTGSNISGGPNLSNHHALTDSSGFSEPSESGESGELSDSEISSSGSDSVLEAPLELDFMTSRRIQDLPKKDTNATDFLRVAARTAARNQHKMAAPTRKPKRKVIRHERSRQSRISLQPVPKETMTRNTLKQRDTPSTGKRVKATKSKAASTIATAAKTKPAQYTITPKEKPSKTKKRKRPVYGVSMIPNNSKRQRMVPQLRDMYFTPIIEQEDGYVYPYARPESLENIEWEVEVAAPKSVRSHTNSHKFWAIQPLVKSRLLKSTFVGSNTLTLMDIPEQWNGESGHGPIIEKSSLQDITDQIEVDAISLIDEDVLMDETFLSMYSYYFQLAAELLRPDVLVDTETRETILKKAMVVLDRILDQIDTPPTTTSARLMFAIFALCAGYSGLQVGCSNEYIEIKSKVFSMVITYLKPLKRTLKAGPPYDRHFVAFELVLALVKLGAWGELLESFTGDAELHWQLIFIDACAQNFVSPAPYDGWSNVSKLLLPEKLDQANCLDYINRCISLLRVWNWSPSRDVPHKLFDYFARYKKYADPHHEAIDIQTSVVLGAFKGESHNTEFNAFLEFLGMSLTRFQGTPQLVGLRNRVTPMSVIECPESEKIDSCKLSGAAQRLSIMLVLAKTCGAGARPPIDQVLGIVKLDNSHIAARLRLLHTWGLLVRIVDTAPELEVCARWISKFVHHSVEQYSIFTCTRGERAKIDGLNRLFEELYQVMLSLPIAANFYTSEMLAPLNFRSTSRVKTLAFNVVRQMPLKPLKAGLKILRAYFDNNSEPMDIWVQVLVRLNVVDTLWPHDSQPKFLAMLIKRMNVSLEDVKGPALEFVVRPSWNHGEDVFFRTLKSVYNLQFGQERKEIVQALLNTPQDAEKLIENMQHILRSWEMDMFERHLYQNLCTMMRQICMEVFPDSFNKRNFEIQAEDQVKSSVLGYIEKGQLLTLEYFMSHKIIAGLRKKEFSTFIKEILPCLIYIDSFDEPIGFDAVVNRLFRAYVWMAIRIVKMRKFVPLFAQIVLAAINCSDSLQYDPLPFVESLASYIAYLFNSQSRISDSDSASLFLRICTACLRQLYIRDEPSSAQYTRWMKLFPDFVCLGEVIKKCQAGDTAGLAAPTFTYGESEVAQDFLTFGADPVLPQEDNMQVTRAVGLFLESYDCFKGKKILL